jgi:DNA (cytosine-5)-methyltransferase 1
VTYSIGSLFSGIGGIELGLERTGYFKTKWQVELDPYCRKVLAKHWPDVPRWDDVTTFPPDDWTAEMLDVSILTGGFPCQDISVAGKGAGLEGERSELFHEIIRLAGIIRPRWLLLENVAALLSRGLGTVLREMAEIGYDAEWHCIPASHVGAPHRRDRIFIICSPLADTADQRGKERYAECGGTEGQGETDHALPRGKDVPDANSAGREKQRGAEPAQTEFSTPECSSWWSVEPDVGRVANGVPRRVDRLKGLGNAVVPQVIEFIGRMIVEDV